MSSSPQSNPLPPVAVSDEKLIEQLRLGDATAFPALVSRYKLEIFNYLARFLGDASAADDVFQETFIQIHQSLDQFDRTRKFRPWLFTIASNKARDYLRAQARQHTVSQSALGPPKGSSRDDSEGTVLDLLISPTPGPEDLADASETRARVQAVVRSMPEHLRTPLMLAYFHQHPYKQIAEILDVPLGTVKSRVHAAVAYFAASWKKAGKTSNHAGEFS